MTRRQVGHDQPPRRPFGRPRKPSVGFCLRLPPEIADQVERDARDARFPTAVAFIRHLVITREPQPPGPDPLVYRELLDRLRIAGYNLNQLARTINAGQVPDNPEEPVTDCRDLLQEIHTFLLASVR